MFFLFIFQGFLSPNEGGMRRTWMDERAGPSDLPQTLEVPRSKFQWHVPCFPVQFHSRSIQGSPLTWRTTALSSGPGGKDKREKGSTAK